MFNYTTVKTGLSGLIGFKNPRDPNIPGLDTGLNTTSSGRYMDSFHPMITNDNLEKIAPDFDGAGYDAYVATATYLIDNYVLSSGIAWMSKTDANVGNTPAVGSYWQTAFSDWLDESYDQAVDKIFSRLSVHKKLVQASKTYLDNVQLFDGTHRNSDTITASGRFVGFEIELRKANNIKAVVDRIGLRFTEAQTDLTLYLFHSAKNTAVATATVTTTSGYNFEWKTPVDWDLPYVNYANNIDAGGKWYIGYFEADITGNALNKNYDFSGSPCGGCGSNDEYYFNLWSKYLTIKPIQVTTLNGTDLFDISKVGYNWTQNWGLNVAFSVKTDFSEMSVNNKNLFTEPLGCQFAVDMLETMAYSGNTRVNSTAVNASNALLALTGTEGNKGMSERLEMYINGLAEDFADISPVLSTEKRRLKGGAL